MKAYVPEYFLETPSSYKKTLDLLDKHPARYRLFAGGTDLMVLFESGKLTHTEFLNLMDFKELKGIYQKGNLFKIGACTSFSEIKNNKSIQRHFPMLARAASLVGADAIQNRATIGGNIVNASPAADAPPALLAYEAELLLESKKGKRLVKYENFHLGYKKTLLNQNEILNSIYLKIPQNPSKNKSFLVSFYRKVGTRKYQAISKVCMAATLTLDAKKTILSCRIALGSVAPKPLLCQNTAAAIVSKKINQLDFAKLKNTLVDEIAPIDDIRSTELYRKKVSMNLLEEFLCVGLDFKIK